MSSYYDRSVMSVERVLSSSSKVQVLRVLSSSSSALSPKELEKETTKNISVIYDAVRELENEDIITSVKADGKTSYYRLNKNKLLAKQIKQLFKSETEEYGLEEIPPHIQNILFDAENRLRKEVELRMVLLFGSVARGDFTPESDIDLYIVLDEKNTEKEDHIYSILERYDKEFSVIIRDTEGFESDFGEERSELGSSILLEGSIILFSSEDELRQKIRSDPGIRNARAHGILQEREEAEKLLDLLNKRLRERNNEDSKR